MNAANGKRRPPAKETASKENLNQVDDSTPGFWRLASMGKVRPVPKERGVTHYCCSCCRWSA